MTIAAVVDLIESLRQSKLLTAQQLDELAALRARFADPRDLARHLIQKAWLTPYQMNQLFQGKAADLVLGPYVILERLGEGGMGQVFKARQIRLDRTVAIKIIRREKLDNPKAVKRFQREIRAAAQLVHPNIVMAIDADQSGQTHFFVMEYVQGIDLNRMVKESGPLAVAQACDYIRQAALGLQHAFERGWVHRDIKPANLLISGLDSRTAESKTVSDSTGDGLVINAQFDTRPPQFGRVKILDMGLARAADSAESNEVISRLTQEGAVIGTPDFIAPEQAMNSSAADIRADLYSLGCTFHFILTGRVPFPGGTLMEKLLRHRNEPPEPLEQLRPDVPLKLVNIVRKLLAKRPEERFQTPAELVAAIDAANNITVVDLAATARVKTVPLDTTPPPKGTLKLRRRVWPYVLLGAGLGILGLMLTMCVTLSFLAHKPAAKTGRLVTKGSLLDKLDPNQVKRDAGTPEDAVAVVGREGRIPLCVAFDSEGKYLASGGDDNMARVWELSTLQETVLSPRHGGPVPCVAFQPRGDLLATVSNNQLNLWNMNQTGFPLVETREADRYETDVVAFAPISSLLATGGTDNLRLWKYEHGRLSQPELLRGHDGPISALAFHPDGKRLVSASRDKTIRLWDIAGRKPAEVGRVTNLPEEIKSLAFSPDGNTLVGGGQDASVRLWKLEGRDFRAGDSHSHHTGAVSAVAFSADGEKVASAGREGQLVLWDLMKKSTRTWSLPPPVRGVAFAPDARHLAVTTGNGRIYIIRVAAPR